MKKSIFLLAVLILAINPAWGQVFHHNDDRDLFIGVDNATSIRPNIIVLADNSGSMNSAIYHPAYNPTINYLKDASGTDLTLQVDPLIFTLSSGAYSYVDQVSDAIKYREFNICRGNSTSTPAWDARARFYGLYKSNPNQWIVYKNTISGTFPQVGQVIDYDGYGSGIDDKATITALSNKTDYWIITVAGINGTPTANAYIYINYRLETTVSNSQASFIPVGGTCAGFDQTFSNVKLFGTHDAEGNWTRYDKNYLYWLAFFATEAQISQVAYWATTGQLPNSSGTLVDFGYYRMEVLRRVLGDVMREVHMDVNLGLAAFNPPSSNEGGYIREPITNFNTTSAIDSMIKTKIDNLLANTNTPLAETLADVWHYIIGQQPNVLQPHTDQNVANDCPLEDYCQKQYVIIMTDGQSTQDELGYPSTSATRFKTSYFANNPVNRNLPGGWGDYDDHDPVAGVQPTSLTKPDGTPYCPNFSCWGNGQALLNGTDYLDDIAYYMAHTDHFSDDVFATHKDFLKKYQGTQSIETYVIGFNMDNDLLLETAQNGNGEYYVANSYDDLKKALTNAIISIQLRNMAFAAFTAPKKITSTVGEGYSFVGYFMPSLLNTIWSGHLQSYKMTDKWHVDLDGSGSLESVNDDGEDEFVNAYDYQGLCQDANPGYTCLRSVQLATIPEWDTQQKILNSATARTIYTHDSNAASPYALIPFTLDNVATLQPLFGLPEDPDPAVPTYLNEAQTIISTVSGKTLGDVFHSDIAYVGPPMPGKKYIKNLNPAECDTTPKEDDPDCFENLLKREGADPAVPDSGRHKVLYVGTNDGILHQVDAVTGAERWGFVPDEVLPSLKSIVIDSEYTYTVDGRLQADDIYHRDDTNSWKTILVFGLKDGGHPFYALDVTNAASQPSILWKFADDDYSGMSWSKPFVGKIRHQQGETWIDRWVVILAGGMAFNNEDTDETAGKAVFVVDASSGELIWMIGYNKNGLADNASTVHIDTVVDSTYSGPGDRYLTAKPEFCYPIPSAITPVDRDSDGYLDTIYFGNIAGQLFKSDISAINPANWKTYQLFKKDNSTPQASTTISSINATNPKLITVVNATGFDLHRNVFGLTSKSMGTIDFVDKKVLTVTAYSPSTFVAGETLVVPSFDPLFLSPAVFYDPCYNLWVAFGSGDRIRSRTNPDSGKFLALRDGTTTVSSATVQKTDILLSDLVPLTWTGTTMNPTNIKVENKWGWQFTFPMAWNHEKLFDPEPLVLPDLDLVPHIYFNTYQPSTEASSSDCDAPKNGIMYFYNLKMNYCNAGTMSGDMESGRIAGGGVFQGTDYIVYVGKGDVASIPPLQDIKPIKLIYTGSLLFMKEKKR